MARTLTYTGLAILASTVWLAAAGSMGWVPSELPDALTVPAAWAGVILLGGGLLLGLTGRVGRSMLRGHCQRCGAPIERGQAYCLDHLNETLNEYRDQTRPGMMNPPGQH